MKKPQQEKKKRIFEGVEKTVEKVKNATDFALKVMSERCLAQETSDIQIGIDDGQGIVKIMMTCKEKMWESGKNI